MFRCFLVIISFFFYSATVSSQDIRYFFKIISGSFYFNDLDGKARDSLLQGKNFYPPDNDSGEIVVFRLAALDIKKNFLRIDASFETGQAGYWSLELRSFKTKSGNSIIVFSATGGAHQMFTQNDFIVYSYTKERGLVKTNSHGLIRDVSIKNFIKTNTPDSMVKKYESYSSIAYDLGYEGDYITLRLTEDFESAGIDKQWLLGNAIEFVWTGDNFRRRKTIFKN